MNFLSDFLSDKLITAFGWNIFHILWQGLIIAVALGIILRFLKRKSAQSRYLVSLISLFLMLGLSVFNITSNFDAGNNKENYEEIQQSKNNHIQVIDFNIKSIKASSHQIITNLKDRLNDIHKYFPLIVNLWVLGVFIFTIKFILSYFYTKRLKKINVRQISGKWLKNFSKIESQLRINKAVNYIESTLVKIPLVLGYIKPVIIIPAEMLTGIPTNQIEAIIAHELAHIRRNDYIFNVLQTMIETVLFFHPAVWYISSQIRKERENSCDDMALTVCDGSLIYAKALVSVQELTLNKHYSAVAFSSKKKHLLNRIKRMIMKPKVKTNFADKIIAAIIIISGVFALSFTTVTNNENEYFSDIESLKKNEKLVQEVSSVKSEIKKVKKQIATAIVSRDTIHVHDYNNESIDIDDNTVIRTHRENGEKTKMKFTIVNGKATDLYVNGKKIQEEDYDKYQDEIDKTFSDLKEAKVDIREAMEDLEDLDVEEIQREVQQAIKDVQINMEQVQKEVAEAIANIETIDVEEIMKNVDVNLSHLEDMDFDFDFDHHLEINLEDFDIDIDEIREEIERSRESIKEQIDTEAIQKEMLKVQEELSKIDREELLRRAQEGLGNFEIPDKEELINDLESKLEELEKLELEEK